MDIHKSKPWHGVREFLKEYVIIVIGVLTALAAEQAAEAWRWSERTHQTEAHLRAELHDMTVSVTAQLAIGKCSIDMIASLEKALVEGGDDWTPPYVFVYGGVKGVISAPKAGWTSEAWRDAQADGTANHLPQAELLTFGDIYENAARLKAINEQQESDMAELNSLGALRRLDTGARAQYLRLIWRVRQGIGTQTFLGQQVLSQADALKVKRARVEEYNPQAMVGYYYMCRAFYSGQKVIPALPGPPDKSGQSPELKR